MTSVRGRGQPVWTSQASEASTNWFNNGDHKDPLGLNKRRPFEAPTEALVRPSQTPSAMAPDIAQYTQKNMDHLLQMCLQASKGRSGDKLKTKTPDVSRGVFYMECYNFCQQCEDHFATYGATGLNQIPFAASFFQDQINFCWQQHKRKLEVESLVLIS